MIQDDFSFNNFYCWEDPGKSVRYMGRIKQLRTLEKSIQGRLTELEKDVVLNKELIIQQKAILKAIQKEIQILERKALYAELGE